MRLVASYDGEAQTSTIAFESNCYTDGFPLVDKAIFYNADFDLASPAFPLAGAILFGAYCGEIIEFNGSRLSLDMAAALQILLPHLRTVTPVEGMKRDMFTPGAEVLCAQAGEQVADIPLRAGALQLASTTWSGDFPGPRGAEPSLMRGAIFTNALLVAGHSTLVSIAIGLLSGGSRIGRLHVHDAGPVPALPAITAALHSVGVDLCVHGSTAPARQRIVTNKASRAKAR